MHDIACEDYSIGDDVKLKVYLAGPMRGIPDFNFPAFHKAAADLRARGFFVFSPAEADVTRHNGADITNPSGSVEQATKEHGFNLRAALAADLEFICKHADVIVVLPNWDRSPGACAEVHTALALGLPVMALYKALS